MRFVLWMIVLMFADPATEIPYSPTDTCNVVIYRDGNPANTVMMPVSCSVLDPNNNKLIEQSEWGTCTCLPCPPPSTQPADLNGDGKVDSVDVGIVYHASGGTDPMCVCGQCPAPEDLSINDFRRCTAYLEFLWPMWPICVDKYDMDGDGYLTMNDFGVLQRCIRQGGQLDTACVGDQRKLTENEWLLRIETEVRSLVRTEAERHAMIRERIKQDEVAVADGLQSLWARYSLLVEQLNSIDSETKAIPVLKAQMDSVVKAVVSQPSN